jgi:hypothetical protein
LISPGASATKAASKSLTSGIVGDIVRSVELTGGRRQPRLHHARILQISRALPDRTSTHVGSASAGTQVICSRGEILMIKLTIVPPAGVRVFTMMVLSAMLTSLLTVPIAQSQRKAEDDSLVLHDYRGIQLGMLADEVRKKLGDPKDKSDEQDFYLFGESETAQIVYDKTRKVVTISADFLTAGISVPTCKQVMGAEVEAKADGSVYRMVRFPKAGYWLSYNRTGGNSPLTTVTLQKIQ